MLVQERNIKSLHNDLQTFLDAGVVKAKAKEFHNVIDAPMLDIELDHVCPHLHPLLGLVVKHHKCLEQEVLGFHMFREQEKAKLSGGMELFDKYGLNWKEALLLREEKTFYKTSLTLSDESTDRKDVKHWKKQLGRIKRSTPQTERGQG